MRKKIGAYLTCETRGYGNKRCKSWYIMYNVRQEKRGWRRLKRSCGSDANDNEEDKQEEEISCTNAPSVATREHTSSLT